MSDTATATAAPPNSVSIADAGPSRKKLTIEVPAETVSGKLRESLDTLSVEAQLPGFRKGRAPRALIEKKFGTTVRDEAKKQIVASAYAKAVEDHKLRVVGEPTSDLEKIEVADGKPLVFDVEVEVMPEFGLPALDGIEVRRPLLDVTDEMVEEEVRKVTINEGALESREAPEPGDYLTGHGIMTGPEGQEFYNIQGCVVQAPAADKKGEGMILGVKVENFSGQFGLPKPGETVTVKTKGPEQHEVEGVRNADLTITFKVDRVDRIIPAKIEDLLPQLGFADAEQLRDAVRQRMYQRVMIQQQAVMRQQVARHLLEGTEMELPERLTAQQASRSLQRQRLELMYRGVEPHVIEERMAELRASSGETAQQELKLFFILAKAGDELNIGVTEPEVNGRIAQMAAERGARPEALRQQLIQSNQVGGIVQQIREHKTLDVILSKAQITDVPAEEFNKLMQEEAKASGAKRKGKKAESADEGSKAEAEEKPKTKPKKAKDEEDEGEGKAKKGSKKK
ncbi:MAG: trigger factor [Phycisphaerales bacterium]